MPSEDIPTICRSWATVQHFAHLGEQRLSQLVLRQQAAKLQQRGAVWDPLTPEVDAHEAPLTIHNGDVLVSKSSCTFSIFRRKTDAQWTEPAVSE